MRGRTVLRLGLGVAATGAATLAYATLVERNMFRLRRYDVPVLAPDAEPLRVLHISDLHLTPRRRRLQEWVRALAAVDPDLVVVTGDNIAHVDAVPYVVRALGPLFSVPGAFVFGSNDYRGPVWKNPFGYFDRDRDYVQGKELPWPLLRDAFVGAGWVDLNNTRALVKAGGREVELAGVDDPHIYQDSYVPGPASASAAVSIGLTHSPEPRILSAMAADGFSLLLAGHTHGGQVRVPFVGALVTNCGLDRRMARGLHRWPGSGAWLHVSAGLGTHPTAPIRFACPPEASVLTLVPR
jgi:predicted MPP superfamily phosphohydrolase